MLVKVHGMWVKNSWSHLGSVMLTEKREEVQDLLPPSEIAWLKSKFDDVKVYKIDIVEVE